MQLKNIVWLVLTLPLSTIAAENTEGKDKKLSDDPTRVETKIGINYTDNYDTTDGGASISGSLAFDPVRKINVRVNSDGSEWRIGGSWLFDIGIVNFNFGENEFEDGSTQTNYSLGTFLPLSYFDIEPFGTQLFATAGYTYNDGEQKCNVKSISSPCFGQQPDINDDFILISNESNSAYVGLFALKPLSEKITLQGMLGGGTGSNDYRGHWVGIGASYKLSERQSLSLFTFAMDNTYGAEEKLGISYKHTF